MGEPKGTFRCPLGCETDGVHPHQEGDLRAYASKQIARFGYRVELISPIAYKPVRDDVDSLLHELRGYTIDAASPHGGEGRSIRQAIATIERLTSDIAALEARIRTAADK